MTLSRLNPDGTPETDTDLMDLSGATPQTMVYALYSGVVGLRGYIIFPFFNVGRCTQTTRLCMRRKPRSGKKTKETSLDTTLYAYLDDCLAA